MTATFQSYFDYINHLISFYHSNSIIFDYSLLDDDFQSALFKMIFLDVDSIIPLLSPLYKHTGRPAKNQIQILRSFILMTHFRSYSIKKWVRKLKKHHCLAALCGFDPLLVSSVSSHYDFMNRLYLGDKLKSAHHVLDHKPYEKPSKKNTPSHGQKWDNFSSSATNDLLNHFMNNIDHTQSLEERFLLKLFDTLAVSFSFNHHLIEKNITISGDGTCFHAHANPHGTKISDSLRRYSDLDANFGWDSDLNMFYFGYTGYSISTINRKYSIDLPVFLTLASASQHDAITSMTALAQLCSINNSLSFEHYCLDCASDNISTHKLAYSLNILPVIDINKRQTGQNIYEPYKDISENGKPICMAGLECVRDGYEKARYRHKFRCPYAQRKENPCPLKEQCTSSRYGRVFHIKSKDDLRLFGVIPYNSSEWKIIYRDRTSCERINNRIINDYKFKDNYMRGRAHNFFMLIMVGINIHLDAFHKVTSL